MKLYATRSNESIDTFKEKMGDEWIAENDSYFDNRDDYNKDKENKKFNILEFVTNSLFNYF